jgi:uncharacterized RDD family membrane protein YckC
VTSRAAPTTSRGSSAGVGDGQTRFLTGEAVHLEVRVARLGSRVMARLIDIAVQVALTFALFSSLAIVAALLAASGVIALESAVLTVIQIISLVAAFIGYPIAMETLTRGRTMGKLAMGLRVVRDDGGPIAFRQALSRGLVGAAIEWPGFIGAPLTWLVTIWTMVANPQSKRLGDHVAGTMVVHDRTPAAWGWVPQMPAGLAGWAATLDLTALDDDLALAVRHYLSRNREIREPARSQLGERLAREVAAVTNPPPPAGAPGWAYLAAVHAERHQRAIRQLAAVRSRAAAVWPDLAAAIAIPTPPAALPVVPTPPPARPGPAPPPPTPRPHAPPCRRVTAQGPEPGVRRRGSGPSSRSCRPPRVGRRTGRWRHAGCTRSGCPCWRAAAAPERTVGARFAGTR